jgi:ribosomal protein L37AE/L43A
MIVTVKKIRNGYLIDDCQKCGEHASLVKVNKIWMCNLCKSEYESDLKAPKQVKYIEKQQSRFKKMTEV